MSRHTNSKGSRDIRHLITITATLCATLSGCAHERSPDGTLYTHGRIAVDPQTAERWDANENDVKAAGDKLQPIASSSDSAAVPFGGDGPAILKSLLPSERHGAGDKRMLSAVSAAPRGGRVFQSSGIVAQVTLVKGSEYKSETAFQKGWLPLAIIELPDTFPVGTVVYPKLKLRGGRSWIYAREDGAHWVASLVRLVDGKIEQEPLAISTATDDKLEPVIGARFAWEDTDESIWVYCGGKCCKMIGSQPL